jgi:hypothetical protein
VCSTSAQRKPSSKAKAGRKLSGGKHNVKMTKAGRRPITLPHHGGGDYSRALTASILREAGLKG